MFDILQFSFMRQAFLIGTIAAVPFGVIGTFIVVRRIGYLAGAIAHCAFGGIGAGLYLQYVLATTAFAALFDPMFVSVAVAVLSALVIGIVRQKASEREDTIIGAIWAVGMAVGLLLLEQTPGYVGISNYLFGNILLIAQQDVFIVGVLSLLVIVIVGLFFKRLEAVCFDEEFARLRSVPTTWYFQLLLVLTALTVVLLVRIVGIVLVIAMLTLPAATAGRFTKRLLPMCLLSIFFCAVFSWIGLLINCVFGSLPAGPIIVLVAAVAYLMSFFVRP